MKNKRQPKRFKSILKQILTVFLVLTLQYYSIFSGLHNCRPLLIQMLESSIFLFQ